MLDMLTFPPLPYTREESDRANAEWKASCGHHSIAAACNVSLQTVRSSIPHEKGWMSPTDIQKALTRLNVRHDRIIHRYDYSAGAHPADAIMEPRPGINRVQFEGTWLKPGVPPHVAYHHTHWIAFREGHVLDTAISSDMWIPLAAWRRGAGEFYTGGRITGWHITHSLVFGI